MTRGTWKTLFLIHAMLLAASYLAGEEPKSVYQLQVPEVKFPKSANVINVKEPPYLAKGDGVTDDTTSIQRALDDMMGLGRVLYFPEGTYLISDTLKWAKKNSAGREAWGFNYLQGQHPSKSILRLRDGTFRDPAKPHSMMWCGGFGSADWFHNYVQGLTFDVGKHNSGASALQFYSNNSGAIRHCQFIADSTSGQIGIDLTHSDMNGPLLVSNCHVRGFNRGIATGHAVNGQTFEYIHLENQTGCGLTNEGQSISIRRLLSQNRVPALQTYGSCCLIDARLEGRSQDNTPAIINFNSGRIYLRDVRSEGYARLLADLKTPDSFAAYRLSPQDQPATVGPAIEEYWSRDDAAPQQVAPLQWRISIEEPPVPINAPVEQWANVDDFGADPTGQRDSSLAIQKALDSGATTIFFPGSYALSKTLIVRGKAQRLVGIGGWLDYNRRVTPDIQVTDGEGHVTFEHFANMHGGVLIDSSRTILFRSVSDCDLKFTDKARQGRLFLEDFVTHDLRLTGQRAWARQLNVENEGTHISNRQGDLWILGLKTERGGTLLSTEAGGRSEVLGGFSYTTTAGKMGPMFVNDQASLFTFFAEVCFNGDPFQTLLVERGNKEKSYARNQLSLQPYRTP